MKDLRRLFSFARPYYGSLALSGIFMGIVTLLDVFRLSAIVPIVDRVFTNRSIVFTSGKFPVFIENILKYLNNLSSLRVLYLLLTVIPFALLIRALFEFLQSYIMSDVGQQSDLWETAELVSGLLYAKEKRRIDFAHHK